MLTPGTVLQNRYRILCPLGKGGMGTVYETQDKSLQTTVALKETHSMEEEFLKAFAREAQILAKLKHEALPKVIDHFGDEHNQFLVMEYISGQDLKQLQDNQRTPFLLHQVLTWAERLLDALQYLHTYQPPIIHRDIKPQNIKLTTDGKIVLMDFGLAKRYSTEASQSLYGYTMAYAPPEQIQGIQTDHRSDLFSLGATLYRLLTNEFPSNAEVRTEVVKQGVNDPLRPAHEFNGQLPPAISQVLHKALALKCEDRFQTAEEFRSALREATQTKAPVQSLGQNRRIQIEIPPPVTSWKVETASFNIHKLVNPEVAGVEYQNGPLNDWYHVKAYVLHRDGHQCRSGHKINHSLKLNVHHVQFKRRQGGNHHGNLLTLCLTCHQALHQGKFAIKPKPNVTKHATEVGVIAAQLKQSDWEFEPTFGYETKYKREQFLKLPKSHTNDAIAICCEDGEVVEVGTGNGYVNPHVSNGDYQQTTGQHSQKRIPTGKLFGLRKFDLIQTVNGIGFITGKRRTGYFALGAIDGTHLTDSVNIKTNCVRLTARNTTLIQRRSGVSSRFSRTGSSRRR